MNLRNYFYSLAIDKKNGFMAGCIKFFLFILSLFYCLVVRILIFYQSLKSHRLNCKVVSVGNITLGGTGKTPLVESIARYLRQKGCKIAILTRGYKGKIARDQRRGTKDGERKTKSEIIGDEAAMLFKNLGDVPVIVDADRIRAANKAIRDYKVDKVILDDGFQQWRIRKDLEIVAIDAVNPFGNRHMLPRGILREPLSSLKRADIFVLTKVNFSPDVRKTEDILRSINPRAVIFKSIHKPKGFYDITRPQELLPVDLLRGKRVTSLCAIAGPDAFLTTMGIKEMILRK